MTRSGSYLAPPGFRDSSNPALNHGEVVASTYAVRYEISRTDTGVSAAHTASMTSASSGPNPPPACADFTDIILTLLQIRRSLSRSGVTEPTY